METDDSEARLISYVAHKVREEKEKAEKEREKEKEKFEKENAGRALMNDLSSESNSLKNVGVRQKSSTSTTDRNATGSQMDDHTDRTEGPSDALERVWEQEIREKEMLADMTLKKRSLEKGEFSKWKDVERERRDAEKREADRRRDKAEKEKERDKVGVISVQNTADSTSKPRSSAGSLFGPVVKSAPSDDRRKEKDKDRRQMVDPRAKEEDAKV